MAILNEKIVKTLQKHNMSVRYIVKRYFLIVFERGLWKKIIVMFIVVFHSHLFIARIKILKIQEKDKII